MPVQTLDQGSLDFGRYRENVQDTYVGPSYRSNDNVDQLVSALARFTGMWETVEAKREENTQFAEQEKFNQYIAAVERDDALGTFNLAAAGRIAPQASFKTRAALTEAIGERYYQKSFQENTANLLNDPELRSDPSKLQAWRDSERQRILEETAGRDFYQAGALKALDATYNGIYSQLTKEQASEMKAAGKEAFLAGSSPSLITAQNTVASAAREVGIDPSYVVPMLAFENKSGDPNAQNPMPGATASGLLQITDGTYSTIVSKYGAQYGLTLANKNDPRANAIAGALYARDNLEELKKIIPNPTPGDVYGAHFLGPAGYKKVLNASPNQSIKEVVSDEAYRLNKNMFNDERGNPLTVSEFREKINGASFDKDFTTQHTKRFDGMQPIMVDQNTFASKHYQWTDFKNDGVYGGEGQLDGRLVNMLDTVTDQFGRGKLKLTSAFRTPDYNSKKSFTKDSRHSHGDALDIDVSNYSDAEKAELVALFTAGGARGIGHYDNGTIHVDLRDKAGKEQDGMSLWFNENQSYQNGHSWFAQGIEKGRQMRDTGVVPVAGFNGQPLNAFDARVKSAAQYGMTEREARDYLTQSIIDTAVASRNPALLDSIPMTSIPLELQNKVAAFRIDIENTRRTEERQRLEDAERRKTKATEEAQNQIIDKYIKGENVDLAEASKITYTDENGQEKTTYDKNLLAFAQSVRSNPVQDPAISVANAYNLSDRLNKAAMSGSWTEVFANDPHYADITANGEPSQVDLTNKIATDPNINSEQKSTLIAQIPQIKATQKALKDPIVTDNFAGLNAIMDGWEKMKGIAQTTAQYNPELRSFISSIRTNVKQTYEREYLRLYRAALKGSQDGELTDDVKVQLSEQAYQKANAQFVEFTKMADAQTTPAQVEQKAKEEKTKESAKTEAPKFNPGDSVAFKGADGMLSSGKVTQVGKSLVFVEGQDGIIRPVKPEDVQASVVPNFGDEINLDEAIGSLKDYLNTIEE